LATKMAAKSLDCLEPLANELDVYHKALKCLKAVHDMGVIHGDIRFANIVMNKSGTVRLIDLTHAEVSKDPQLRKDDIYALEDCFATVFGRNHCADIFTTTYR